MHAVLEDAFNCFIKQFVDDSAETQRLAKEAEEWFFAEEEHWPFSFVNISSVLGIDPTYMRRGLKQWLRQRPDKIKHLRRQVLRLSPHTKTAA